jgi:hypothetical protein
MSREMMVYFSLIGMYTVWILLPLVPAILIYWLFPNTTVAVSGPLSGLTVKAGGAFAAYMVVFAGSYSLVQTTKETIGGFQRQFWTINGLVKLVNTNGQEITSQDLLKKIAVSTKPDPHTVESYHVRLKILEDGEGGFPLVVVQIPQFGEKVIDLKSTTSIDIDSYHKTIALKEPIIIQEFSQIRPYHRPSIDSQEDDLVRGPSLGIFR